MKKNEKTNSKANNVEMSKVTFAAAKEFKTNQGLSFSQTIKNLGAPYAPANKFFDPDTLKLYGINSDSSIHCFRAILIDERGNYKIYRALEKKYTTTKGPAAKALNAFEAFVLSHDYFVTLPQATELLTTLRDAAAKEAAAKELQRKERERAKEAAQIERFTAKVTDAAARDSMIEQLQKQLAALQNMQF